ncbi:hypothetical protein BDDG_12875 [Blastomyces dermatitidis ATCC 18188]|uniref:Secreted protein n=1 Tax=Ajellomyces dermatitidis (strain ATCC 18188 / CBS 674.68) TaxID=653446 RepID=A0A0J9ER60_AJEDA|nr:hypothetical protein BDDG_12875 [Blastomyces dermatitidis ATCC 18188]
MSLLISIRGCATLLAAALVVNKLSTYSCRPSQQLVLLFFLSAAWSSYPEKLVSPIVMDPNHISQLLLLSTNIRRLWLEHSHSVSASHSDPRSALTLY